jgi:hypothetical protein
MVYGTRPIGITALSLFFIFGTIMSGLAAAMLLIPGSALEPLWRLNPHAREGFAAMGNWAMLLMAVVCVACAAAAIGLWRCARWGYWTALVILCVNLSGDTLNILVAHDWRTLVGLPIGGVMLAYLISKRRVFEG